MIIWLEGADGAGKTTTAHKLYDMLANIHPMVCHAYHVDCVTFDAKAVKQQNFDSPQPVQYAARDGILIADRCAQTTSAVYRYALPERGWEDHPTPKPIPVGSCGPHPAQLLWVLNGGKAEAEDYTLEELEHVRYAYESLVPLGLASSHVKGCMPEVDAVLKTFRNSGSGMVYSNLWVKNSATWAYMLESQLFEAVCKYAHGGVLDGFYHKIYARKNRDLTYRITQAEEG